MQTVDNIGIVREPNDRDPKTFIVSAVPLSPNHSGMATCGSSEQSNRFRTALAAVLADRPT